MSEKYREYCMKFSNEEIKEYMVDYLISNSMDNKLIKSKRLIRRCLPFTSLLYYNHSKSNQLEFFKLVEKL